MSSQFAQLSRKDLQALAKQRGVAANKTSAWLCDELARLAGQENLPDPSLKAASCNTAKLPARPNGAKLNERAPRRRHPTSRAEAVRADPAGDGEVAMNFLSLRRSSASSKINTQRTAAVAADAAVLAKAAVPAAATEAAKATVPAAAAHAVAAPKARREAAATTAAHRPEAPEGSRASAATAAKAMTVVTQALRAPEAPKTQGSQSVPNEAVPEKAAPPEEAPPTALCVALEELLCNHAALFRDAAATLLKVVANLRLPWPWAGRVSPAHAWRPPHATRHTTGISRPPY